MVKNALVIAADRFTTIIDWKDRNTCVLFGDGAGAAVLAPVEQGGILSEYMISDGDGACLMGVTEPAFARRMIPLLMRQTPFCLYERAGVIQACGARHG